MDQPRHFKSWIAAYAEWVKHTEAPPDFHRWIAVGTIAGALRRYSWIDQRYWMWIPNFYIFLVAPPGIATKTTTINLGERLLRQVPGTDFAPTIDTWQNFIFDMAKFHRLTNTELDWSGDWLMSTCRSIFVGELGTLIDPRDEKQNSMLTDIWDNKVQLLKGTKTNGQDNLYNPWVNIIAGTTPSWLGRNFPENLIGDGLASRVVWVFANTKSKYVAYGIRHGLDEKAHKEYERKLVEDLIQISQIRGNFKVTDEAMDWGEVWHRALWERQPAHLQGERYQGYVARRQTHLHKLGMILSASRGNSRTITLNDLKASEMVLLAMEQQMLMCFGHIGTTPSSRASREILEFLKLRGGQVSMATVWKAVGGRYDIRVVHDALNQLKFTGRIDLVGAASPQQGVVLKD